jgi:hypothetical protein
MLNRIEIHGDPALGTSGRGERNSRNVLYEFLFDSEKGASDVRFCVEDIQGKPRSRCPPKAISGNLPILQTLGACSHN